MNTSEILENEVYEWNMNTSVSIKDAVTGIYFS